MSMDKQKRLTQMFSGNTQLPTLPVLFDRLNEMLENPFTSNRRISELIMKDQAMVSKILQLCNSAMYSKRQEITNLSNAITFLGTTIIRNLILQIALVRMFDVEEGDIPEFSIHTFWEHSLGTAYFAGDIVKRLKLPHDGDYYIGGLLHDIGKLVIYQYYPAEFAMAVKKQMQEGLSSSEAEEEVLGVNHQDVGTFLVERWKFKREIIDCIRCHHRCLPSMPLHAAVVRIADLFAKSAALCFPWDRKLIDITGDPAWEVVSANTHESVDLERLTFEIADESEKVKASVTDLLSKKHG